MEFTTENKATAIKKMVSASLLLAVGIVLPSFTGPQLGSIVLPMHIPALLAGLVLGWKYGAMIGFIMPLFRSVIFGMPPMFPVAVAMAFELSAYALVIGLLYGLLKKHSLIGLMSCLVASMVVGRIVWGIAQFAMLVGLGMGPGVFTIQMWFTSVVITSIPGIVMHLMVIPILTGGLIRAGVMSK